LCLKEKQLRHRHKTRYRIIDAGSNSSKHSQSSVYL
jgi:hypothetical protein